MASSLFFGIKGEEENEGVMMNTQHVAASQPVPPKKRRNPPYGEGEVEVEVVALSPGSLMATNRFVCEVCQKGFQREQNLQLHRRGHNLPWKLKQHRAEGGVVRRKVYLCPEPTCPHHHPARALGDLTGIKKHFSRKHGEKKYTCAKCSKMYAVHSDWKAHSKTCGSKEYKCDCGTLFLRRDSFMTHRAFCDALAQESGIRQPPTFNLGNSLFRSTSNTGHIYSQIYNNSQRQSQSQSSSLSHQLGSRIPQFLEINKASQHPALSTPSLDEQVFNNPMMKYCYESSGGGGPHLSATALLQKAALLGSTSSHNSASTSSNLARGYSGGGGGRNLGLNSVSGGGGGGAAGGVRSSIFNRYCINNYDKEESYGEESGVFSFGQVQQHAALPQMNMDFQGSDALTFTFDFLGQGQGSGRTNS